MLKFWKKNKQKVLTVSDFRKENPQFEVFYKNKKWQGKIFGWMLTDKNNLPILKLSRYSGGKLHEETIFDLNWHFLIDSWQKNKGKINIPN